MLFRGFTVTTSRMRSTIWCVLAMRGSCNAVVIATEPAWPTLTLTVEDASPSCVARGSVAAGVPGPGCVMVFVAAFAAAYRAIDDITCSRWRGEPHSKELMRPVFFVKLSRKCKLGKAGGGASSRSGSSGMPSPSVAERFKKSSQAAPLSGSKTGSVGKANAEGAARPNHIVAVGSAGPIASTVSAVSDVSSVTATMDAVSTDEDIPSSSASASARNEYWHLAPRARHVSHGRLVLHAFFICTQRSQARRLGGPPPARARASQVCTWRLSTSARL